MKFIAGSRTIGLDRPRVMAILNVTPDSFSDGGQFRTVEAALTRAATMVADGADIIDVGGESTRPGADPVAPEEELQRVIPVIEGIVARHDVLVSVDTGSPDVIRAAVSAGAEMINDVYALRRKGALAAAAGLDAAVCLMHMRGTPDTMQDDPQYQKLPGDVVEFLRERVRVAVNAGIDPDRIIVDPGFGFGKTDRQNLTLLANLRQFSSLGRPLLVGLSRKRTLGNLTGRGSGERLAAGLAAAVLAVQRGASIVRTHDVAETVDVLKVLTAIDGAERER